MTMNDDTSPCKHTSPPLPVPSLHAYADHPKVSNFFTPLHSAAPRFRPIKSFGIHSFALPLHHLATTIHHNSNPPTAHRDSSFILHSKSPQNHRDSKVTPLHLH